MDQPTVVSQFTDEGMDEARNLLSLLRGGSGLLRLGDDLFTDHRYSTPLEPEIYVEPRPFANRREAGEYLADKLSPAGPSVVSNHALWSWLGMYYLETMTQGAHRGRRAGEYAEIAYLIDPVHHDSRDRSHHRLLMAYDIWTRHGEKAWMLLDEPVNSMPQFTLRVVQSPEIFRSHAVVELIHTLYADPQTGRPRKGVLGPSRAEAPPGSLPRLIDVLSQFSMTYDVYGMSAEKLRDLLPPEFD